jgi:membrane-bound ClpP family serine protease
MSLALIVTMILFGFVLIIVEIFLTPGFIVGLIGMALIAVGLGMIYREYGSTSGHIALISSSLVLVVGIVLAFKGKAWQRFALKDEIKGKANKIHELNIKVGDQGSALSALRPAGTALINNQKLEVHTDGEFLLANDKIEVEKILHSRIIVKKIESNNK